METVEVSSSPSDSQLLGAAVFADEAMSDSLHNSPAAKTARQNEDEAFIVQARRRLAKLEETAKQNREVAKREVQFDTGNGSRASNQEHADSFFSANASHRGPGSMSRASSLASSRGSSAFMPSTIGSDDGIPDSFQQSGRADQFVAPSTPKHGAAGYDDLNQ
eukprot:1258018-Karenia_brevis.AAC.1